MVSIFQSNERTPWKKVSTTTKERDRKVHVIIIIILFGVSDLQALLIILCYNFPCFKFPPKNFNPSMEKRRYGFFIILTFIALLGLLSFTSCIAAELKRTKKKDLKLDGSLCNLPRSQAFGFGIGALISLVIAQTIGNLIVFRILCFGEKGTNLKHKTQIVLTPLLIISWISFGLAITLVSSGTSMSSKQPYGKGWLKGECYLVKDGVFLGSAILVLITIGSTLVSAITTMKMKTQVDQEFRNQEPIVGGQSFRIIGIEQIVANIQRSRLLQIPNVNK